MGEPNKKKSVLGDFNLSANGTPDDGIPFRDKDIINIQRDEYSDGTSYGSRAINFQYILRTGVVTWGYSNPNSQFSDTQMIDLRGDDLFTHSLEKIQTEAQKKIQADPELSMLLEKKKWSRTDRVAWEKGVSQIVSDEMDQIPSLDRYRTGAKQYVEQGLGTENTDRTNFVNNLSADIEKETKEREFSGYFKIDPRLMKYPETKETTFNCENMSIVEGVVLQKLDNTLLPAKTMDDDYKKASNYFYVAGSTKLNALDKDSRGAGHAWIVSSATGNIVEATERNGQSPYREAKNPNFSFEDFVKGEITPFGKNFDYYGGYNVNSNGVTNDRIRESLAPYRTESIVTAEEQTKLFLDKAKTVLSVEGMDQLREATKSYKYNPNDPHLQNMIKDMMSHSGRDMALQDLNDHYQTMVDSWRTALKMNGNNPAMLQNVKWLLNQHATQIESSIENIPHYVNDVEGVIAFSDEFNSWKSQNIGDTSHQTQIAPAALTQNATVPR